MQKIAFILLFVISPVIFIQKSNAQIEKQLDSLCVLCQRNTSDSEKVYNLDKLAAYYYIFKLNDKADSVIHEQLQIAQMTNNKNLLMKAYFGDAVLHIGPAATNENFKKAISFIKNGIDYAQSNNDYNFVTIGYIRLSDLYRKHKENDQSLANAVLALSTLERVTDDSVKAICYITLGDSYLSKDDAVSACRNFNTAFDIALKMNSVPLQSRIYHCLFSMYRGLNDNNMAREELNKSFVLNKKYSNLEGMTLDYIDLAKLTDEKYFIEQAIALADSVKNVGNLLYAKRLMLVYYYVKKKDLQKSLEYFNSEPDLKKTFLNNGAGNYLQAIGNIYFYCNRPDSALIYYKLAQNEIVGTHDDHSSMIVLMQVASSYGKTGQTDSAIAYYKRAHDIAFAIDDVSMLAENARNLSDLYNSKNDFKNAYFFLQQSQHYTDSLKSLSAPSDITLLGVERENKKHEQELLQMEKLENNKRNLQYMSITIAIVVGFFIMLIIGSYSISKTWVRVLGYFFFISLFEFIVLLIDNLFLTHAAHNQPLKIWLIKIGLIGMLAPFQHFLETNLIGFLASRKLMKARTNFSLKKSWAKIKKPSSHKEEGLEKDAAVM